MRNAQIKEERILYWPSGFLPFWHLMPMGEKFRGFRRSGMVLIIHAYLHFFCLLVAWMCI